MFVSPIKIIFWTTVNVFATRLGLLMFITNNQTQRKESARNYDRRSQAHNRGYFAAQAKAENLALVLFCCFCVVLLLLFSLQFSLCLLSKDQK